MLSNPFSSLVSLTCVRIKLAMCFTIPSSFSSPSFNILRTKLSAIWKLYKYIIPYLKSPLSNHFSLLINLFTHPKYVLSGQVCTLSYRPFSYPFLLSPPQLPVKALLEHHLLCSGQFSNTALPLVPGREKSITIRGYWVLVTYQHLEARILKHMGGFKNHKNTITIFDQLLLNILKLTYATFTPLCFFTVK